MAKSLTKAQQEVLACLQSTPQEISAQQLHLELRQKGARIGLATVYRTLKSLHLQGVIQERITPNGESLYHVIADAPSHYHHLNCVRCGQAIALEHCPLNQQFTEWCRAQDFKLYYHTLEFFGLCHRCQISTSVPAE